MATHFVETIDFDRASVRMIAAITKRNDRNRRVAAQWWWNMRRGNPAAARLARRRFRSAGYELVDILLLAPRRQGS